MSNRKRNFTITKFEDNDIYNDNIIDDIFNFDKNDTEIYKENKETNNLDIVNSLDAHIICENDFEITKEIENHIIEEDINSEKIHIYQCIDEIDTFVINSSNIYTLSVLGLIDKLILKYNFKINNVKNYISSSFGTIVSLYFAFGYSPKDILLIFFEKIKLNGNILNIHKKYGIFELDIFIDELLKPLFDKIGYIPTLMDIYKETGKNIVFLSYNLTLHKSAYFDFKNNPNDKIDILVKTCCNIPIIFTKYLYNYDMYIDYTFISKNIEDELYNTILHNDINEKVIHNYKRCVFDINILKKEYNDVKNMNISEYIFYIFELLSNQKEKKHYNEKEINITIDTEMYDVTLFLDNTQRCNELIKLYNCGFDKECEFVNINFQNNHDKYSENKSKNNFEGVVFSGGGANNSILLGMYKYIYDEGIIFNKDIKVLVGTSAGSILSALLSMNFEPTETIKFFFEFKLTENIQNSLKNMSIVDSIQNKGMINNNILLNYLENILIKYNDGIIPTLLDIKNKYNKELVCVTYNITKNRVEYLNYENSPELLITHACVMSSCIPILFNPFEYKNNLYLDGCIGSNFPIEYTYQHENINFACFGFDNKYNYGNLLEYLMSIMYVKRSIIENKNIENTENCEYFIYNQLFNTVNPISSNKNELFNIYINGYNYMKEKFRK